ncbi:unnamed protein product, partial [Ectocarpus sp. 12 AP-2014]
QVLKIDVSPCPSPFLVPTVIVRATILYLAVQNNMTEVVRFLLEEGADMDMMPNEDDGTPSKSSMIEYAAFAGSLDSMNLLIQAKMFR